MHIFNILSTYIYGIDNGLPIDTWLDFAMLTRCKSTSVLAILLQILHSYSYVDQCKNVIEPENTTQNTLLHIMVSISFLCVL